MKNIETLSLKATRGGHRVYLNNKTLERIGFKAGVGFKELHEDGQVRVVVDTQAQRKVLDSDKGPLMDLRNKQLGDTLPNCERVTVQYKENEILITAYHHTKRVWDREKLFLSKVRNNTALRMGDLFAGIGLLSRQIHKGLMLAGLTTAMAFANEYERLPSDVNFNSNEIWQSTTQDAVFVNDNILTMNKKLVPQLDCLVIGYPCRGFSRQQGTNRNRDLHHETGNLFIPTLDVINRANPALVVLENSDHMIGSDTLMLIDSVMKATGYYRTETVLNGREHGDFELRKRLCVVWVSEGLKGLDLSNVTPIENNIRTVADILEPIANDDKAWKDLSHVAKKTTEKSHSHKMCVSEPDDTTMPTIPATYAKIKADTPMIAHPTDNGLHRILTSAEHANVRRIDGQFKEAIVSIATGNHHLTNRTNATASHMMLGNSVAPSPWVALGHFIGRWAMDSASPRRPVVVNTQKTISVIEQNGQFALAF
ncbi:MAG: DNA (cytosine-5)-methyltransferase 1 [Oleiphilaceae bacterium]|jgi:DNA (cytosine-5)-methyltransferase 1